MTNFKCYIVDDEPLALNVIEQHLSKFGNFEVCGKTTDPVEALAQIKRLQPDLLFLDIEMPDITGLELIKSMQHRPQIIITTAYRDFAVEGFELNVLDYLVKPIPFNRFVKAIDKFLETKMPAADETATAGPSFIFVKADRKTIRLNLEDILVVEGVKDYVKIILPDHKIMTKVSIGNFLKELPPERFIQVHKSFIVNRSKITAFTAQGVELGEHVIPVGRVYREAFFNEIDRMK